MSIQQKLPTTGIRPTTARDTTPPPTPTITMCIAFDKAKAGSSVRTDNQTNGVSVAPRDPFYMELGNVEVGTRLEIVNLSAKAHASFKGGDKVSLELTGRDVQNRQGAVYLNQEQMEKIGIKPGDILSIRAVDEAGNASAAVNAEIRGNEWANGHVVEDGRWSGTRGAEFSMLDGEAVRKNVVAKAVNDTRPPVINEARIRIATWTPADRSMAKLLSEKFTDITASLGLPSNSAPSRDQWKQVAGNASLPQDVRDAAKRLSDNSLLFANVEIANSGKGHDKLLGQADLNVVRDNEFSLLAPAGLEPGATLTVQNQRTGESVNVTRSDLNVTDVSVGLRNLKAGDPLVLIPVDNNGVRGKEVEVVYTDANKRGVAPKLKGGLSVRLPGAID
jgi:hypothetical protein